MTIRNWITVEDEEPIAFSELSEEKKKEISEKLNVEAAKQIGYERTA